MKKYNLSKIMKRAWEIFKCVKVHAFSECLKKSWQEAKQEREDSKDVIGRVDSIGNNKYLFYLEGNTYPYKEEIKKAGFKYSPVCGWEKVCELKSAKETFHDLHELVKALPFMWFKKATAVNFCRMYCTM